MALGFFVKTFRLFRIFVIEFEFFGKPCKRVYRGRYFSVDKFGLAFPEKLQNALICLVIAFSDS